MREGADLRMHMHAASTPPSTARASRRNQATASLSALIGRARTPLLAGFAGNFCFSFVNGLMPSRAGRAGFFTTTNFAKPGSVKTPFFLSSRCATSARASTTSFTCFLERSYPTVDVTASRTALLEMGLLLDFFAFDAAMFATSSCVALLVPLWEVRRTMGFEQSKSHGVERDFRKKRHGPTTGTTTERRMSARSRSCSASLHSRYRLGVMRVIWADFRSNRAARAAPRA